MGKKGIGKAFLVVIAVGFGLIGLSFLETPFPDFIPLSVLQQTIGCDPDEVECFFSFPRIIRSDNVGAPFALPLNEIDVNSPMTIEYQTFPINIASGCEGFEGDITINLTDENRNLITVVSKGKTEIQPLIMQGQQTLIFEFVVPTCPTGTILFPFRPCS